MRVEGELPALTGAHPADYHNGTTKLDLAADTSPQHVLEQLVSQHLKIEQFEIAEPTLDEIFIRAVREETTV